MMVPGVWRRHGLHLNRPQHAAVFCVDEKTAIQSLDRMDPVLPLSPARVEKHGFEHYRHGTVSIYAAFNPQTGKVMGRTAARHTTARLVAVLTDIDVNQLRSTEIHVIADNLSAHKRRPWSKSSSCGIRTLTCTLPQPTVLSWTRLSDRSPRLSGMPSPAAHAPLLVGESWVGGNEFAAAENAHLRTVGLDLDGPAK